MAMQWMRRAWVLAAASALLLSACGGGNTVTSRLSPSRVIAFGDAMADVGQDGARYTVNDGSVNNWVQYVAGQYNQAITPSSQGGLDYAWGNARVAATPDAAGVASTPTVKQQVDQFLATHTIDSNDLVIVSAGTADVIKQVRATIEGQQTSDQAIANADQAGSDMADQVKRLISAGAQHVVISGPYDLGRSPWAIQLGSDALLHSVSSQFNNRLLVSLVSYGATVLYVDAALYFNQETSTGSKVGNYTAPVCTSIDPGPGIGTGPGQLNSHLCSTGTLVPGVDYNSFLFADLVYPTPRGHQLFGDYAYGRIRDRW
jgi:outer membrane lipase/esterase